MNVSNLVLNSHSTRPHHSHHSDQQYPAVYERDGQPHPADSRPASTSLPFRSQPAMTSRYSRTPRAPPSPPVEETTSCTLPSIQSLMVMAGNAPKGQSSPTGQEDSQHPQRRRPEGSKHTSEPRPYGYNQSTTSNPKGLPLTPPLGPKSGFDDEHQSPITTSRRSSVSTSQYMGSAINNMEPHRQRQPQARSMDSYPVARQPSQSPYTTSPYASSPIGMPSYSYPSPTHPPVSSSGMYYQRPLPTTFTASDLSVGGITASMSNTHTVSPVDHNNPWQHHHYISPSASAAFAGQTQDRYICPTCNKAFSRPSSLRIHSHSHTGEKPFKCQHAGCGKAFSVRSNMKRHERGCHGGGSPDSP